MFPDARISLRRWSVYAETKIPIPMAITLHNFIAPSSPSTNDTAEEPLVTAATEAAARERLNSTDNAFVESLAARERISSTDSNASVPYHQYCAESQQSPSCSPSKEEDASRRGMWQHRQAQHNNNLLPRLRLEITAKEDYASSEQQTTTKVVYSQRSPPVPSLHPSWEHLDEGISIDECEDWWNQNELYKSMKVGLSVLSSNSNSDENNNNRDEDCFLEAYLHPSFLERIDLGRKKDGDEDDLDRNSLLPPGLPPNALLIHFSDGSIRCPPHIYQILSDNYSLEPPPVEDFSRFEDDVFATLDHVKQTPQRPQNRSVSSLLDQDDSDNDYDSSNNHPDEASGNSTTNGNLPRDETSALHPSTPPRSGFGKTNNNGRTKRNQKYPQHEEAASFPFNEQEIEKEERRQEKLDLLRLIVEEERALEEDIDCLRAEQLTLTHLVEEVQSVERDISKVKAELQKQLVALEKEEILKESQSIKLLRDLRDIYPITQDSTPRLSSSVGGIIQSTRGPAGRTDKDGGITGYLIRGLRLPTDIYTTTISEEEVNTSLGYCAHLVFMVAKYLAIPLRHRIFCNGSRSAIELDSVGIFPLFLGRLAARALEREQVDRGARLLGTNVDCILMHLGLMSSPSTLPPIHILARLQSVFDFVAEGRSTP